MLEKLYNTIAKVTGKSVAPFIGISRHRLLTDGDGVTTLVAFHGCPLHCKYCLNPQSLSKDGINEWLFPENLFKKVRKDEVYFRASGGGITFGGGEPCLRYRFICDFRKLCGKEWRISVETSLNVPSGNILALIPVIDEWIVDIKDCNAETYLNYTGKDNKLVLSNLKLLSESQLYDKVLIRVPLIPKYNVEEEVNSSIALLEKLGYTRFEKLTYTTAQVNDEVPEEIIGKFGKMKCDLLRGIRNEVAADNEITFRSTQCNHKSCTSGHCPACEAELAEITEAIRKKQQIGIKIQYKSNE